MRSFAQVGTRCRLGGWRAGAPVLVVLVGLMWSMVLVAPAKAQTASMTLRSAVAGLPVVEENRLGYDQGGAQSRFAWSEAVFEPRGRSDAMG